MMLLEMGTYSYLVSGWGGHKFQCKSMEALTKKLAELDISFAQVEVRYHAPVTMRDTVRAPKFKVLRTITIRR